MDSSGEQRSFDRKTAVVVIALLQFAGLGLVLGFMARRDWRRSTLLLAAGSLVAAAAAVLMNREVYGYALATIGVAVGGIVYDTRESNPRPSHLSHAVLGGVLGFAVYSIWMFHDPETFSWFWQEIRASAVVATVQRLALFSTIAFVLAMTVATRALGALSRPLRDMLGRIEPGSAAETDRISYVIFAIGSVLFFVSLTLRGFGYLGRHLDVSVDSLLGSIFFLYYLGLYLINAAAFGARRPLRWILAIDAIALGYEVASGSKGRFAVYIIFPLILLSLFFRERISWRRTSLIGTVAIVAAFVIYPLLVEYRQEVSTSAAPDDFAPVSQRFQSASDRWSDRYGEKVLRPVLESNSAEQVLAVTAIVHYNVRLPQSFISRLTLFWVPRFVWPSKPTAVSANEIGRASHRLHDADIQTSVLQTGIGELYVFFGPDGAWAMLIGGFLCRFIDAFFSPFEKSTPWRAAVGLYLLVTIPNIFGIAFEGTITGILIALVVLLGILVIAQGFTRRTADIRPVGPRVSSAAGT